MRLTPLRSPPTRPRTGSVRIHPRKRKEDPKQRQPDRPLFVEPSPRSAAFWPVREAEHGLGSTRASAARDPLLILFSSPWVQATEICRRPVGLGARGCQPHGPEACLGRVGQDAQPGSCRVRRTAHTSKRLQASMDGFTASPAIRPTPPTRCNPAVAVAVDSAGAGLQALQSNYVTQPAITSRARTASHSSSIRHTKLIASRRSGNRCHTGSNPASV